ncbi:MAG: GNAT family N-acetyltransferase [Tatlockia sp.]
MLLYNNYLDATQLQALMRLTKACREQDGALPSLYPHILEQKRQADSNLLFYAGDQLVGFLSCYFFYTDACEISVLVDPLYRKQGIAKQLLEASLPLLAAKQMERLIFSTPATQNEAWLSHLGFVYTNSEYQMQRNSYEPILLSRDRLETKKGSNADIETLCTIDALCFEKAQADMIARFNSILDNHNYTLLIALQQGNPIGKAHIRWEEDSAILSDIAIIPTHQRQGLGSELLANCINHALTCGKTRLTLDVETSNQNALKLYLRHGFKTINAVDYWEISTEKFLTLF